MISCDGPSISDSKAGTEYFHFVQPHAWNIACHSTCSASVHRLSVESVLMCDV